MNGMYDWYYMDLYIFYCLTVGYQFFISLEAESAIMLIISVSEILKAVGLLENSSGDRHPVDVEYVFGCDQGHGNYEEGKKLQRLLQVCAQILKKEQSANISII